MRDISDIKVDGVAIGSIEKSEGDVKISIMPPAPYNVISLVYNKELEEVEITLRIPSQIRLPGIESVHTDSNMSR